MSAAQDYTFIREFIDQYQPQGFTNIRRTDQFLVEMEHKLSHAHQFFYIADLLKMEILFTSSGSLDILGVDPDQFNLSTFIVHVHPEERSRYSMARAQLIKAGYELLIKRGGVSLISTQFRVRNGSGNFINLLFQVYSFYRSSPANTVNTLLLLTDLSAFKIGKYVFNYYIGNDLSMFRYPDQALLNTGYVFSGREFEIIRLIAEGLGSEQIADKLFLSINTVNTHRRNILRKAGKSSTHELILALQERGIL